MNRRTADNPRGMTLVEFMMALVVMSLIAGAIAAMLGAVMTGVGSRRDNRSIMISAAAADVRISAYVALSRCVLANSDTDLVLWFDDARESGSVHATEIRWLRFDTTSGSIDAHYVTLPSDWSQTARDLEDHEYTHETDWNSVMSLYKSKGWTSSLRLVDGLDGVSITVDERRARDVRHVNFQLQFESETEVVPVTVPATIRLHSPPQERKR